jgi:hypothetical protein
MPSKTDFNVSPYFDDFDRDKKFHRVMYRPAFAVQARELTTQQSILQNQIELLGDSMYKHGSMVIPGEATFDLNYFSIKLTSFTGTLANFKGTTITGGTSGVTASVLDTTATDGTDPDTLFVKYKNSGTDNVSATFTEGESLSSDAATNETAIVTSSHTGSAAFIDAGTYYINGYFVEVESQSLILDKYTNTPDYRVGLSVAETFVTSTDDTSLLDNATGSSNVNATGAHRFKITLTLAKLSLESTADANFVETFRVKSGKLQNRPVDDVRTSIEDTLARRTYDESGDYTVDDFELNIREHLLSGTNRGIYSAGQTSDDGNTAVESKLAFGLSQGKAYVKGYEIKKIGTTYVDVNKARDFETDSGSNTRFDIGSFVNVENVHGTPDINFVSGEIENYKALRLCDESHATRGTVLATGLAHNFDIGRAKTRAFEYNSGNAVSTDSGTTTLLSSAATTDVKFKHFLFDIDMFTHINVAGAMSGALTTGDKLTGGTSGATGIIESVSTAGSATITGATRADPVVVTMSGGHNFTEGQNITIANVVGMTDINGSHSVKNATATTFELFEVATASNSTPEPLDGTGFTAYASAGTAVHTTIILSDLQGEFVEGETITAPTNSRTGTIQFNSYGCKGFEQKTFDQTKGISMAGSPTYTADVSLDSVFGDVKTLQGTISTVSATESQGSVIMDGSDANGTDSGDSIILEDATEATDIVFAIGLEAPADLSDRLVGSGTTFLTDFKIGDSIEFVDDGGSVNTRIIESISSNTILETSIGLGTATATSKTYNIRRAKLQDAEKNIGIFKLPYNVVKTLLTGDNSGLSDTSLKIRRQFVTTLSSSGTATLTAGTNEVFSAFTENDYAVSIMTTGSGATGAAGDLISLSTGSDFTLGGSPTGKTLAINLGSGYNGHKIKVTATISASVVGAKTKTNTSAQTLTIDTEALATDDYISLGKADVHKINSIFMAADFSTAADTDDVEVTDRFELDTGQRDNYYDISRLKLKKDKVDVTGRLLINFDYFEHGAGNFFSVDSYSGFDYSSIPAYTSDVTGQDFSLRDCLDFRPRVDDASTINSGGVNRSFDGTGASAIEFCKVNSDVTADLEYYLSKRARIYLSARGQFKVVAGASAIQPGFGEQLKDAIHLYDVFMPAFTFDTSTIEIKAIDNRRYTMRDIGGLHKRIETMEFYTQLSLLETAAQSLQIQDADGFDRFKNGIIVDNFTGHGIGDVTDNDYSISMDMAKGELRPSHHMDNSNLIESDSALANSTSMTDVIRTTNGYQKTGDLITLPYTEFTEIEQQYASTTVNLNPYDTISFVGNVVITPDQDDWMETETLPEMTINIPGVFDTLTNQAGESVQELNLGTVWDEWNNNWSSVDIAGTEETTRRRDRRPQWPFIRDVNRTTVDTQEVNNRTRTGVRTTLQPGGLRNTSIGNRVVQVAFATFIRAKDISFTANGMKPGTRIFPFFDSEDVSAYVTPTGSSAGAALTTDAAGSASGVFALPTPTVSTNPRWRVGKRTFRLTSSSTNVKTEGLVTTSAETDYTAKGLIQTVQGTVVSTRETQVQRTTSTDSDQIIGAQGTRVVRDNTGAWFDPVCQSFMVDKPNGLFVSSIEVFFKAKSSALPVTLQIRTMVNGYPTTTVVPFAQQTVQSSDVTVSEDASAATKFTFPSPVFLQNGIEYAFCVITNNDEYLMYTSRLGQTTLDGARLISQQPYLGSMFKSQNASTWTSEQNEDVKFKINRCKFTENTEGTVTLVNDVVPVKTLKQNPITTTSGSAVITIHHRNHGMHSTANNVTIAGVASGTFNGIASTNINGTYTAIGNIKLHSYTVTAANSDTADATGDIGGTAVTVTRNMMYDVIKPIAGVIQPPGTEISSQLRTTSGKTLEGGETEFSLTTVSKQKAIELNEDCYLTAPAIVASAINETNEMSGSKSLVQTIKIKTQTGDDNISPVIDTTRLSCHLIRNHLFNPVSGTTPGFIADTAKSGGSSPAKYITRPIQLANEATAIDVRISAYIPGTSEVEMYFRLSNADDSRNLKDTIWTPFNTDGSPDKAVAPSDDDETFREYQYSAKDLAKFTSFQIKLVMKGTVSSYPPRVKDLRGIALAV